MFRNEEVRIVDVRHSALNVKRNRDTKCTAGSGVLFCYNFEVREKRTFTLLMKR